MGMAIQEHGDKNTIPAPWECSSICCLWHSFVKEMLNRLHPIPYPRCFVAHSILDPGTGKNCPAAVWVLLSHSPRTGWLQICRKPLLPPEDRGRGELAPAQAAGSEECPLPSPHQGNDPFSGKRRENHSLDRLSPHCSQQGRLHHPRPSAAKGSHCQLEAQAAPG